MAQSKNLVEEVATVDRADRRAATVRKASRIACSLASSCANVNEFRWT